MLVACICFVIGIFFILLEYDEFAIIANTLGFIITLNALLSKKVVSKNNTIDSTKETLKALAHSDFEAISFKILKKDNNPYIHELETLSEIMQKRQNKMRKRIRKLHEKNIQNTQLLSTISHEIKNPLSIIQASAETLVMQPNLDVTLRSKLLNRIMVYGKKINALLNKLTLSQSLEHSVITIKMEKFSLQSLCEEVIDGFKGYLLKNVYTKKKIILEGNDREIFADRILIEQVLNNLIYNALKYADSEIIVRIKDKYFEVIDDGNGVEKSEIKELAKKFYQGKDAKHTNHALGLGLFIVKEIAKIHNAKLEFFSKRNKKEGLCVRFIL